MIKHCDQNILEARNQIYFLVDALGEWADAPGKPSVAYNSHEVVMRYFNLLLKKLFPSTMEWMREMVDNLPTKVGLEAVCNFAMVSSVAKILVGVELKKDEELIRIFSSYFCKIERTMCQGLRWMLIPFIGSRLAHSIIQKNTPSITTRKQILEKITPSLKCHSQLKMRPKATSFAEMMLDNGNMPDTIADTIMILVFLSNFTVAGLCQRVMLEQIETMPKLDSTLRESMRHHASHPEHFRMAKYTIKLPNRLIIPKGKLDGRRYSLHPLPHLKPSQLTRDFLLFGAGKHAFPGRLYATQVIKAFIATLLRSYRIHTFDNNLLEFNTYEDFFPDAQLILTRF
ncbi:hypothetical protein L0F63_002156 [Massospora cicadina]|nr:hypothetical protein L0F63_002156 [Massospora cicadina]